MCFQHITPFFCIPHQVVLIFNRNILLTIFTRFFVFTAIKLSYHCFYWDWNIEAFFCFLLIYECNRIWFSLSTSNWNCNLFIIDYLCPYGVVFTEFLTHIMRIMYKEKQGRSEIVRWLCNVLPQHFLSLYNGCLQALVFPVEFKKARLQIVLTFPDKPKTK